MTRRAEPVDVLIAKGKKHLTKAEIAARRANEIKITGPGGPLVCPEYLEHDELAFSKWNETIPLYKDVAFVSSEDVGLISRYCTTYSEYRYLLKVRDNLVKEDYIDFDQQVFVAEMLGEELTAARIKALINKINYLVSVDGVLKLDKAVNSKLDQLNKMEDRLFLNPLAKIKNIPKQAEPKKKDPDGDFFD